MWSYRKLETTCADGGLRFSAAAGERRPRRSESARRRRYPYPQQARTAPTYWSTSSDRSSYFSKTGLERLLLA